MDMIRTAVSLYEPGILGARDGTNIGTKTMAPLRINEASPPLGTRDNMEIYIEILPCHALSNWIVCKLVREISAGGAAPSALDSDAQSHPGLTAGPRHCRAYGPPRNAQTPGLAP